MFHQLLEPVASNLFLSFLVGFIPILVVLILLGIVRLPAWQASLAGLVVAFIIAIAVWQMPVGLDCLFLERQRYFKQRPFW